MVSTTRGLPTATRTRGTALPSALLVLVVLTLLGTAAVFTAGTELDIAGNSRRELQALSVAEAGVHEALARLNMRTGAAPNRIRPGDNPPGSGTPDPNWTLTIVNASAPGANELQTMTGSFGSAMALPLSTVIRYKRETAENPIQHCNADGCTNEVVHFHTGFSYTGIGVPIGGSPTSGPPVLQLVSTFTGTGAVKTLLVETTRAALRITTTATVRACGSARVKDTATVNGALHMPAPASVQAGTTVEVVDAPTVTPAVSPSALCPANLFAQTFGMSQADMLAQADITAANSEPPSGTKGKIIYVTGDAEWRGSGTIGTASEPVILVVDGGRFELRDDVTVNGIIYVIGDRFRIRDDATLNGAVVVWGDGPLPSSERNAEIKDRSEVVYDPNVINGLANLSPYATILWKVN